MTTTLRRTSKALLDCYSYKGHDFQFVSPKDARLAKKVTRRSRRRLDRALERNGGRYNGE